MFTVDNYFFCVDLKLGTIIMAWWGMIFSGISIVGGLLGLLFNKGHNWNTHFPVHFNTGSGIVSAIIALILLCLYFYFSYQLLMGAQSGNSQMMVGYLIMHGIWVILWILGGFTASLGLLVMAVLYVYLWFCVYSFYVKCGA